MKYVIALGGHQAQAANRDHMIAYWHQFLSLFASVFSKMVFSQMLFLFSHGFIQKRSG